MTDVPPSAVSPLPVARSWSALLDRSPGFGMLSMLSFGAAAIHFAVSPDHFAEWVPYGIAFACLAWFQLIWSAAYLVGPSRRLRAAAIAVNAAVVVVWVWSRSIGLPIGPDPGTPEPVGFADALSSALEGLLVAGLIAGGRLADALGQQPSRRIAVSALVAGLVVLTTVVAMAGLAPEPMVMG